MTDQHDELASAYLDGELTPDELAMVEASDEVRASAAALGDVGNRLATELPAPDPALRRRHLATALDAFDAFDTASTPLAEGGHGQVVEFGRRRRWWQAAPPAWLGAAAALVLVVAGLGWVVSQSQSDDAADTAAVALDEGAADESESTGAAARPESADDEAALDPAAQGETATDDAAGSAQTEAAEESEESAEAPAEEADEAADLDAEDGFATAAPDATTSRNGADGEEDGAVTGGGLAPNERVEAARVSVAAVPTGADMAALLADAQVFDAELSSCGLAVTPPSGAELVGFVPLDIDRRDAEMLVYEPVSGGEPLTLVVDDACTEL